MTGFSIFIRATATVLLIATATLGVRAQQAPLQDKPFADHKIVLQLSDNDPRNQGLVISVANNLMKFYDPDKVAVEIVTFGPGIDLLRPENPNRKAVESLVAQGARVEEGGAGRGHASGKPCFCVEPRSSPVLWPRQTRVSCDST